MPPDEGPHVPDAGPEEPGAGGADEEGNWLGEYASTQFAFAQMEEHGVDVTIIGGNVRGEVRVLVGGSWFGIKTKTKLIAHLSLWHLDIQKDGFAVRRERRG